MRALLSVESGGPDTLVIGDMPDPSPGPDDVLIRVRCCGLNYPDTLLIRDQYQVRPPRPFSPGCEIAGEVLAVGANVTSFQPHDKVCGLLPFGGLAEKVAMPAAACHPVPQAMTLEDAGAFLLTYGTAYHALVQRAALQPGERLLVLGASGGTGLAAIQIGRAKGAHVIAAASSEDKSAVAVAQGAAEAFVYSRDLGDPDAIKQLTATFKRGCGDDGVDVVFDAVGGPYTEAALRATNWGGRVLIIGFLAGISRIPMNLPLLKGAGMLGVFFGRFAQEQPALHAANVTELMAMHARGEISPVITHRLPLARAAEGLAELEGRTATGKILVLVDE